VDTALTFASMGTLFIPMVSTPYGGGAGDD